MIILQTIYTRVSEDPIIYVHLSKYNDDDDADDDDDDDDDDELFKNSKSYPPFDFKSILT